MEKLLILKAHVKKYTEVAFLRTVFAWLAKAFAIAAIVWGIIEFIDRCSYVGEGAEMVISWIVMQALWIVWIFLLMHIWWMKGTAIAALKDKDYVLTPVVIQYLKGWGESLASYFVLMTCSAFVTSLLNSARIPWKDIQMILPVSVDKPFLWSIVYLANGVVLGILAIGMFYFIAELLAIYLAIGRKK